MPVGCQSHLARIVDKDGAVVGEADALTEVAWGRALDDTAGATATIVPTGACCEWIGDIRSWRHRLVIWRGGHPVFDGPLVLIEWESGQVQLTALDCSAWLERRVPHQDLNFIDTDLATIARELIEDAFSVQNPGVEVEIVERAKIEGDRSYELDTGQTWDHLRDLSDTGLDWTVVGSKILLMGESFCQVVGSLDDSDFTEGLRVIEDGAALATRWIVFGDEDLDIKGTAGGTDPYYGLLEITEDQDSILDTGSANAAALAQVRASNPAPVFIDTGQGALAPTASIDVNTLVPGYCLGISTNITCREVIATQKIGEVRVTENAQGEQVRVFCLPPGDIDAT